MTTWDEEKWNATDEKLPMPAKRNISPAKERNEQSKVHLRSIHTIEWYKEYLYRLIEDRILIAVNRAEFSAKITAEDFYLVETQYGLSPNQYEIFSAIDGLVKEYEEVGYRVSVMKSDESGKHRLKHGFILEWEKV